MHQGLEHNCWGYCTANMWHNTMSIKHEKIKSEWTRMFTLKQLAYVITGKCNGDVRRYYKSTVSDAEYILYVVFLQGSVKASTKWRRF